MTARRRRILPVVFAPTAIRDLEVIWHWNEKTYGVRTLPAISNPSSGRSTR